ncbi:MAG: peptidylprolyl isomerase [Acidothermaceae bacterium]
MAATGPNPRSQKAREFAVARAQAKAKARRQITISIATGVIVVIVVIVLAVTFSSKKSNTSAPAASAALALTGTGSTECQYTPSGTAAKDVGTPPAKGVAPSTYKAALTSSQGTVVINLDGAKAPCTVNSFIYLAAKGYFNATSCHRLTTSGIFVLQCGDPTATGSGGPGYQFADENLSGATYPAGTVAMANAGQGTNGSQFFLVYNDTTLPPSYTPFGTITSGLDVLKAIAAKGTDDSNGQGDGHPNVKVTIDSVIVTKVS